MSSKTELYDHLKNHLQVSRFILHIIILQYYLPPYEMFTKDFVKEVFASKKKLLKLKEVKFIQVIKYDELSVKNLYSKLVQLDGMADYFPSNYPKGRHCDREYMFNIANTLHEDIIKELVDHALKQRHDVNEQTEKNEAILMDEKWVEELQSLPIIAKVSTESFCNIFYRKKEG